MKNSAVYLCRSPRQTQGEFDKFADNLELNLDLAVPNDSHLVVDLGDLIQNRKIGMAVIKPIFKGM